MKYELKIKKMEEIKKAKNNYDNLLKSLHNFNCSLQKLGYNMTSGPTKITELLNDIFKSLEKNDFMPKDEYCNYIERIIEIENIFDYTDMDCRIMGSDFCSFHLLEFTWLATHLLELGTYDNILCPDFPCTTEIIDDGQFSYFETNDMDNEIIIDSPEKCWNYLKKNYDET